MTLKTILENAITRIAQHACRQGEAGSRAWPPLEELPLRESWAMVGKQYASTVLEDIAALNVNPEPEQLEIPIRESEFITGPESIGEVARVGPECPPEGQKLLASLAMALIDAERTIAYLEGRFKLAEGGARRLRVIR